MVAEGGSEKGDGVWNARWNLHLRSRFRWIDGKKTDGVE